MVIYIKNAHQLAWARKYTSIPLPQKIQGYGADILQYYFLLPLITSYFRPSQYFALFQSVYDSSEVEFSVTSLFCSHAGHDLRDNAVLNILLEVL